MKIESTNGNSSIKFLEISNKTKESPFFREVKIEIKVDNAFTFEKITFEQADFVEINTRFNDVCNKRFKTYSYTDLDDQFFISLNYISDSRMQINGYIRDVMYSYKLDYDFEVSFSEIMNFINSIKTLK